MADTLEKKASSVTETPKETIKNIKTPEQIQEERKNIKEGKAKEIQELHLETMSNKKFLEMDRKTRLESITYEGVDIDTIGNNNSMTFRFDFGQWVDQTDLYRMTTAGQVLPATVRDVQVWGIRWTRNGLYGEFFNDQGQRLVIHEKTKLVCSNVISKEDVKKMEDSITSDNEKYKDDTNYTIILECAKRNIPYEIAINVFVKELTNDGKMHTPVDIEELITKFERAKDSFNNDFPTIAIQNGSSIGPEFLSFFLAYTHIKFDNGMNTKFGITEEIQKTYNIIWSMRVSGSYGTYAPLSETVKTMADLNPKESIALAKKIFHTGPATDLLIAIDEGTGVMIKRMIALWYHEGWLKFGRQNPDPASGYNYGTFQIGGSNSTPESSLLKYNQCLEAWINLAKWYGISTSPESITDLAQKDLIAHLGYIDSQRWGNNTFTKLRDGSLSDGEVVDLMSNKIQWGISAIWKSVVSQIQNTRVDTSTLV